jgi:hypothetical protein
MGYEIWDDHAAALLGDFDELEQALGYLRDWVRDMTPEDATHAIEGLHLASVSDQGRKIDVVARGVELLTLIFAPAEKH